MPLTLSASDIAKDTYLALLSVLSHALAGAADEGATPSSLSGRVVLVARFGHLHAPLREALAARGIAFDEFAPTGSVTLGQLRLLNRARLIIVDDYYAPLAALRAGDRLVIQTWHANGAMKRFGHAAKRAYSARARARHQRVYDAFDMVCVGSQRMAACFAEAFGLPRSRMLPVGYPRMDAYLAPGYMSRCEQVRERYGISADTTSVLYVPTFREPPLDMRPQVRLLQEAATALPSGVRLFHHLHPHAGSATVAHSASVTAIASADVDAFIGIADLVITDYSALLFERALLGKPAALYAYDAEDYEREQGLFVTPEHTGLPVFARQDDLLDYIAARAYSSEGIADLGRAYNEYNHGDSAVRLVEEAARRLGHKT